MCNISLGWFGFCVDVFLQNPVFHLFNVCHFSDYPQVMILLSAFHLDQISAITESSRSHNPLLGISVPEAVLSGLCVGGGVGVGETRATCVCVPVRVPECVGMPAVCLSAQVLMWKERGEATAGSGFCCCSRKTSPAHISTCVLPE